MDEDDVLSLYPSPSHTFINHVCLHGFINWFTTRSCTRKTVSLGQSWSSGWPCTQWVVELSQSEVPGCTGDTILACNGKTPAHSRVRPMYESASADSRYRFCKKNSKQQATTLKSDPRQPPRTTTHAADRRGGRRCGWSSGGRRREGHATVATRNWSSCYVHVVDGTTALCLACLGLSGGKWPSWR